MLQVEAQFAKYGQGHVFRYLPELSDEERAHLRNQADAIDLDEVFNLKEAEATVKITAESLTPPKFISLPEHGGCAKNRAKAKLVGEDAIREGKVAAITVAGGQGTRLGFPGPKGAFPATVIQGKSLFQVFAEKIMVTQRRYGVLIPWFLMTSEENNQATIDFFEKNKHFGLEHVHFFKQRLLPVFNHEGKILMATHSSMALSPDGHGGIFSALNKSGAFDLFEEYGTKILSYFQVDNPLVHCVDPIFIGYHLMHKSEMSSKMVRKVAPEEKVGVFGHLDNTLYLIEYSDFPIELTKAMDPEGNLLYSAGNPAIHLICAEFAERVAKDSDFKLPYHRTKKCVSALDASGKANKPDQPNAIKWEMFIFEALPMAKNPLILETLRDAEFSPIKNASGFASQETCFNDQNVLFAHWLEVAGVNIARNREGRPVSNIEISPLFADTQDAFVELWNALEKKPEITENIYIQ